MASKFENEIRAAGNDKGKIRTALDNNKAEVESKLAGDTAEEIGGVVAWIATWVDDVAVHTALDALGDWLSDHLRAKKSPLAPVIRPVFALLATQVPALLAALKAGGVAVDINRVRDYVVGVVRSTSGVFVPKPASAPAKKTWGELAVDLQDEALNGLLLAGMITRQRDRTSATIRDDNNVPIGTPNDMVGDFHEYGVHGLEGLGHRLVGGLVHLRDNHPEELARIMPHYVDFDTAFHDPKGSCRNVIPRAITARPMIKEFWLDTLDLFVPKDNIQRSLMALAPQVASFIGFTLAGVVGLAWTGLVVMAMFLAGYHVALVLLAGYGLAWFVHGLGITSGPWPWQFLAMFFGGWGTFKVNLPALMTGMVIITGLWRFFWTPPGKVVQLVMWLARKVSPAGDGFGSGLLRALTFWARNNGWLPLEETVAVATGAKTDEISWWRTLAITVNLVVLGIGAGAILLDTVTSFGWSIESIRRSLQTLALVGGLVLYISLEFVSLKVHHFPLVLRARMSQTTVGWLMPIAVGLLIVAIAGGGCGTACWLSYNSAVKNGWVKEGWQKKETPAKKSATPPAETPAESAPTTDPVEEIRERRGL